MEKQELQTKMEEMQEKIGQFGELQAKMREELEK